MIPGQLNKIIEIQKQTAGAVDASGGPTFTWSTHVKGWAKVMPLRGREMIQAHALKSEGTVMFVMRYAAGILPSMRVVFDSKYYNIEAVNDMDSNHKEIQILARVGVNDGN